MRPRVEVTVCCALVVPSQVMAKGVASGQPAATSILPSSAGPASAPSTTSVAGLYATRLTSAAWITRSSPFGSVASGMPAYAGTAVASGTPGTISNLTPASAHAVASAAAPPLSRGSPPYSRTASWPSPAACTRARAAAPPAGSSSRAPGLMWRRATAASSGPATTSPAWPSSSAPRTVSSPPPPGPAPTRATHPGCSADSGPTGP